MQKELLAKGYFVYNGICLYSAFGTNIMRNNT